MGGCISSKSGSFSLDLLLVTLQPVLCTDGLVFSSSTLWLLLFSVAGLDLCFGSLGD